MMKLHHHRMLRLNSSNVRVNELQVKVIYFSRLLILITYKKRPSLVDIEKLIITKNKFYIFIIKRKDSPLYDVELTVVFVFRPVFTR